MKLKESSEEFSKGGVNLEKKIPLIVIVGPTASGKTALSINLAKRYNAEIISADSMQVYKSMDIATAKPDKDEMDGVVHHLIDFVDINHRFSVAEYLTLAKEKINDIYSRGKNIVIVGGTGLYINSLIDNIEFEEERENNLRQELMQEAERMGGNFMLDKLRSLDPEYADKLFPNDIGRIIRGIEINLIFGHSMSEHKKLSRANVSPYTPFILGIAYRDREKLYDRINKRVDIMLENGLLNEAEDFFNKLGKQDTAVQAIGYKELFPYLKGEIPLSEAVENLKKATRNYAKRQITWFKKDQRINWIYADEQTSEQLASNAQKLCDDFLYID